MTLSEIISYMQLHPFTKKNGAGMLASRLHASVEDIKKAKEIVFGHAQYSQHKLPKILIFDTETAPMRAYVWRRWKQNISLDQTISEWFMLAWSAKWLYSAETLGENLTSQEAKAEDDSRIVADLWKLIDEADIVVAYNGKKADIPWCNSRFVMNGLKPPKPYFLVDPLITAKHTFGFSSNKLDALAGYFDIPHKMDTDFDLWKRCMEGDQEALDYMGAYNKKDTDILELVYLKLRPWIKGHPNVNNYIEAPVPVCAICGSENLERIEGQYYYTSVCKYELYRCLDCGAVVRGRRNLNTMTGERKQIPIVSSGK